jgi:hypothetical protein
MEIADVPLPDALERGALLVRTTAATVCATDVHGPAASDPRWPLSRTAAADCSRIGYQATGSALRQPM